MRHVGLAVAFVVVGAGCNSLLGIDDFGLRGDAGGGGDDDGSAAFCYGTYVKACFPMKPSQPVVLATSLDTDHDNRCVTATQTNGPDVCAIGGSMITMSADTIVTGSRPLVLVSTSTIAISKKLDASSRIANDRVGPGANSMLCAATINGNAATGPGGGGGGASGGAFGTGGGGGGAGMGGGFGASTGGRPAQTTMVLRGGCPGGSGGNNPGSGGLGGGGGASGGAIALVATTITITDEVRASGAAGRHGTQTNAGGGGGGSGGMIVLEGAVTVMSGGQIVANGGGGGEASKAADGHDGKDDLDWNMSPAGGTGLNDAGDGGAGSYVLAPMAMNGSNGLANGAGGGGGGGGAGIVLFHGTLGGGNTSPAPNNF